jgi:thiol-disulfide isomerase/thioredoxin
MKNIRTLLAIFGLMLGFSLSVSAQGTVLTSLDNERIDVQGQKDKVVILAVGATWLPLTREQVNITNKLAKKYAGKGVAIYFVVTDSTNPKSKNFASDADIRAFTTKNKLNAEVLRDSDGLVTLRKFGIDQLPSFVVLDKTGRKSGEVFSGLDPENDLSIPISKLIDRLL